MKKFLPLFIILFSLIAANAQVYPLNDGWTFSEAGKQNWKPAFVPGNVHLDLQLNVMIADPTVGENYKACAWVETKDWEYKTSFSYPDVTHFENNELVFDGLDTYADVYLNDVLILKTDNMFRQYIVQVKKNIKEIDNVLRVVFHNPVAFTKQAVANAGVIYPTFNDASYPFTRKEAIQYGWDFTQRQLTCGIWRNVTLRCWNNFIIRDLHAVQKKLDAKEAVMDAVIEVESNADDTLYFDLVRDRATLHAPVKKGMNTITLTYTIQNPKRWWPNGMGEQKLYELYVQVTGKTRFDWKQVQYGLRTVEVINKCDENGKSFYLLVNGLPIYMKGTNYVPPLNNYKVPYAPYSYENIFSSMKNCNMNMVRVWGGGVYEDDAFYKLADQNGILVWQDLMFTGTMYPGDTAFLNNVSAEIEYNVKRLRNHPCLALWCGNNEIEVAWKNWGWQKKYKYSAQDSTRLWNDYQKLFTGLIPEKINALDKGRFYFSSTPQSNWGKPEDLKEGDNHYWGVWHGEEPFEAYTTHIPRFMSEFGFQSFPALSSLKKFSAKKDWDINAPVLTSHQFSYKGNGLIEKYMSLYYKKPKDFESWLYLSQLLQAEGMKLAIESQRKSSPFCMGSLCWQLNDHWPAASWSTIDFYGKWKAAQYFIRDAFKPVLLTFSETKDELIVNGMNDGPVFAQGVFEVRIMKLDGTEIHRMKSAATLDTKGSVVLYRDSLNKIRGGAEKNNCLVYVAFVSYDQKIVSSNIFYFCKPKELLLQKPVIENTISKDGNKITVTVTSNVPAKNVFVSIEGAELISGSSDNYFDLLPYDKKVLVFYSDKSAEELKKLIQVRTLRDTY